MVSDRWIEESLYRLAQTAWGVRRISPTSDFILQAEHVRRPITPNDMAAVVQGLYSHARKWAPGFEVPYYVPKVNISTFVDSAGQYRVDPHGYVFVDVSPEFLGQHAALLAILAHEACHHILDLSGIRVVARDENERLTDLAIFVCGFGDILLNGHSQIRRVGSGWVEVHLGYLSPQQYRLAQQWVVRAQRLEASEPPRHRATDNEKSRAGGGFVSRIRHWLLGSETSTGGIRPGSSDPPPRLFDVTAERRKVVLARLGGNRALLSRLLDYERRRHPDADEIILLDAVIDSLERDRG